MKRLIVLASVLLLAGIVGGAFLGGCATAKGPVNFPALAEEIRKGQIDVGKQYGVTPDLRFHKIHSDALAVECAACHVEKFPAGRDIFAAPPAVDVSKESPAPVDRRVCLGCHTGGVASRFYGP
jgi:hypothetical protein